MGLMYFLHKETDVTGRMSNWVDTFELDNEMCHRESSSVFKSIYAALTNSSNISGGATGRASD